MGAPLPRLGLTLPQFTTDPTRCLEALDQANTLGFAGAFVFDHLWPLGGSKAQPVLESWTLLGALAARAAAPHYRSAIRVGTLVTRAGLRPPALLAHMARTVAGIAGAPAVIAIGTGDSGNRAENDAYGLPFGDAATRLAAARDAIGALRAVPLGGAPEVWAGGNSERVRQLAAESADAWNCWSLRPQELRAQVGELRGDALRAGREPGAVAATWGGQVLIGADADEAERLRAAWGTSRPHDEVDRLVTGSGDEVVQQLRALGEAGAAWCVCSLVGTPAGPARERLAAAAGLARRS